MPKSTSNTTTRKRGCSTVNTEESVRKALKSGLKSTAQGSAGPAVVKATVTESNGEISCSIEETNRIRKELGLKPLNVSSPAVLSSTGSSSSTSTSSMKVETTEDNGEISCSIAETNRIRAELGLKPLNTSSHTSSSVSSTAQAFENFAQSQAQEEALRKSEEVRLRIDRAKARRLEKQEADRGVVAAEAGELSAAEWVARSRQVTEQNTVKARAAKTKQKKSTKGCRDGGSSSIELEGVALQHSAAAFAAGEDVILTLADSEVLQRDENGKIVGAATDEAVLENVLLRDAEKRSKRDRLAARAKQPMYSGFDDDEFDDDFSTSIVVGHGAGGAAIGQRGILAHYDVDRKEEQREKPKLVLGRGGTVFAGSGRVPKAEPSSALSTHQDSAAFSSENMSEYYSKEEYEEVSFKSKKGKKRSKAKTVVIRKKASEEADDDDDVGDGNGVESTMALKAKVRKPASGMLLSTASSTGDRMSRAQREARLKANAEGAAARKAAYADAVARANAKSASSMLGENETDGAAEALADQRLANPLPASGPGALPESRGASFVMKMFDKTKSKSDTISDAVDGVGADGDNAVAEGKVVFTSASEFSARLETQLNAQDVETHTGASQQQQVHQPPSSVDAMEVEGQVPVSESTALPLDSYSQSSSGGWAAGNGSQSIDATTEVGTIDSDGGGKVQAKDVLEEQPLAASGMAATLALLKGSGDLKAGEEKMHGRAKDSMSQNPSERFGNIKLEYRDEFGRLLSQKEAYRQMAYKFHGIKPGKKKQEKRLLQYNEELKAKAADKGTSQTMEALSAAQQVMGTAGVAVERGRMAGTNAEASLEQIRELARQRLAKRAEAIKRKQKQG